MADEPYHSGELFGCGSSRDSRGAGSGGHLVNEADQAKPFGDGPYDKQLVGVDDEAKKGEEERGKGLPLGGVDAGWAIRIFIGLTEEEIRCHDAGVECGEKMAL